MSDELTSTAEVPVEQFKEVVVEEKSESVEKFKAQLIQSIEINDRLIAELEKKEKELSVFKELQNNLELLVVEKDNVITQLEQSIEVVRMSRFTERKNELLRKWITKFNLSPDQTTSVQKMLSKFTSEDELGDVERMLEVSVIKRVEPVPLTQTSTFLDNAPVALPEQPVVMLTPQQKIDQLWNKIEKLKGV
jgi:hypothetical protein